MTDANGLRCQKAQGVQEQRRVVLPGVEHDHSGVTLLPDTTRLTPDRSRQRLLLLGLLPVVAAIFRSTHATSKIAFLGAAAVFATFSFSPVLAKRATIAGWAVATLLVVPLALLAYSSQLYSASWLTGSAQQRVVIWGYTGGQIAKAPVFGVGIATPRALNDPDNTSAPLAPGSQHRRLGAALHSHNAYLQVWHEAGAVGAFTLFVIGILILRSLGHAPLDAQSYLYATFAACALVCASSFSLWAPWFLASLGFSAVFATLGAAICSRPNAA